MGRSYKRGLPSSGGVHPLTVIPQLCKLHPGTTAKYLSSGGFYVWSLEGHNEPVNMHYCFFSSKPLYESLHESLHEFLRLNSSAGPWFASTISIISWDSMHLINRRPALSNSNHFIKYPSRIKPRKLSASIILKLKKMAQPSAIRSFCVRSSAGLISRLIFYYGIWSISFHSFAVDGPY